MMPVSASLPTQARYDRVPDGWLVRVTRVTPVSSVTRLVTIVQVPSVFARRILTGRFGWFGSASTLTSTVFAFVEDTLSVGSTRTCTRTVGDVTALDRTANMKPVST